MKNKSTVKPTKDVNAAILAAMKEGYSQRKAISIAGLKNTKNTKNK